MLLIPAVSSGGGGGETNTAVNVGAGAQVFRDKTGVDLNLRTLTGLGGVTAVVNGDVIEIDGSGVGGATPWTKDEFVPTDGQVSFILSGPPTDLASFELVVNGVEFDDVVDYTVSGTTLTWLNTPFSLRSKDKLIVQFK